VRRSGAALDVTVFAGHRPVTGSHQLTRSGQPIVQSGLCRIQKRLPGAELAFADCTLQFAGLSAVRCLDESITESVVDVLAHERVKGRSARCDALDLLGLQPRQYKAVSDVDAELVSASTA